MSTPLKALSIVVLLACFFVAFSLSRILLLRAKNPILTAYMMEEEDPIRKKWVPLSRIAPPLQRAVLFTEDGNFYNHHGIDFHEAKEAIEKNMEKGGYARGFSTITMQLARNLYLSREKTLFRKTVEIIITWEMEWLLPKRRILELYLNVIEWGPQVYGAEAASQYYFQTSAGALTNEQAAFLAAIIPNPKKWGQWPPGPYIHQRIEQIRQKNGAGDGI